METLAFDQEFYARQLAGELPASRAWEHFRALGQAQGLCPHPLFDPVSWKLAHPGQSREGLDPWEHFLAKQGGRADMAPPPVSAHFPSFVPDPRHAAMPPGFRPEAHDACTPEQALDFASADCAPFQAAGNNYALHAPPVEEFLQNVERGQGFALVKYPHGLWTCLRLLDQAQEAMRPLADAAGLGARERANAASRLVRQRLPQGTPIAAVFAENFLAELVEDMAQPPGTGLWRGAAFKGYPTRDGRVFIVPGQHGGNDPLCASMTACFARAFSPSDSLFDGTMVKRWAVSGGLRSLPGLLLRRPVAIVGPAWFAGTGRRWNHSAFTHLRIPPSGSFALRHAVLRQAEEFLLRHADAAPGPPTVLFHCGGSLAAWLIVRLAARFPAAQLLDLGQGLATWHLDEPFYAYHWVRIYKRALVENNGLEPLYRALAGRHYEEWLGSAGAA